MAWFAAPRVRLFIGLFIGLAIRCAAALFAALGFTRTQNPGIGCLLSGAALAFAAVIAGASIFAVLRVMFFVRHPGCQQENRNRAAFSKKPVAARRDWVMKIMRNRQ